MAAQEEKKCAMNVTKDYRSNAFSFASTIRDWGPLLSENMTHLPTFLLKGKQRASLTCEKGVEHLKSSSPAMDEVVCKIDTTL